MPGEPAADDPPTAQPRPAPSPAIGREPAGPAGRTVLVADGVRLTRDGVRELLQARGIMVETCSSAPEEIVRSLARALIDLVVCNSSTSSLAPMVAAIRSVRAVPVVAMSVKETVADVALCAELDLAGFVLADDSVDDLVHVIRTAELGRAQCPPHAIPMLMHAVRSRATWAVGGPRLTSRETEIVKLLQDGLANKEIALELGITARTVKNHLHHAYGKLGVHSRGEAVALFGRMRAGSAV